MFETAAVVERLFGYSPRLTLEKLRVAEALEGLPQLAVALRDGNASWSSLRELTRVATRETEGAWLEAARGRTMREVEKLVSGHRSGDLPGSSKEPGAERHVLRFEVSGDVLATVREALAKLRRDAGGPLDDDAALLSVQKPRQAPLADGDPGALVLPPPPSLSRCSQPRQFSACWHPCTLRS